uniref:Uncharacterized protein n=1 Tax=Helianthus annuus TaxID=4232 RepID=A0A251UW89_HELAN
MRMAQELEVPYPHHPGWAHLRYMKVVVMKDTAHKVGRRQSEIALKEAIVRSLAVFV